jgi:hypothetical protein
MPHVIITGTMCLIIKTISTIIVAVFFIGSAFDGFAT